MSDVNEVIHKFITQEETHKNLVQMTEESQHKIDKLLEQKRALQERVETLTYAAHAEGATLERVPTSIADPLATSASAEEAIKAERQRHKYERMSRILINVKAGIQHLTEKLEAVPLPAGEHPIALTDDTLVDVLLQNESRLRLVLEAMRVEEEALEREGISIDDELRKSAALQEPTVENNLRIQVRATRNTRRAALAAAPAAPAACPHLAPPPHTARRLRARASGRAGPDGRRGRWL